MTDKPLHVQVAEALGWTLNAEGFYAADGFPSRSAWLHPSDLPRYDTSWESTGPLIEKYGITLRGDGPNDWHACERDAHGGIEYQREGWHEGVYVGGNTPLLAVCHLILALKEAGKL